MVLAYSLGKKSLAPHQPELEHASRTLSRARGMLLSFADEDALAYERLNALQKLPESDPRRVAELPGAIDACVQTPLACVATLEQCMTLLASLPGRTNPHLRSDLAIAAVLTDAALRSSAWNVRINAALLPAGEPRSTIDATLTRLEASSARSRASVESACAVGLTPPA
jgi:formiminotetrahydrofolate cyclodeaminase